MQNWGIGPALAAVAVVAGVLVFAASALMPQYATPPLEVEQTGFRGTGMVGEVGDAAVEARLTAANALPLPPIPLTTAGPKASEVYENVQVLGDLSQTQFTRLMLAITEWVSPEQGCTYCHAEGEGFAADTLYSKRVSRWMIQMTRHINNEWTNHVRDTGVNCYTCHRGNNVPQYVWFDPEVTGNRGLVGYYSMLYGPNEYAGLSSLSQDPLGQYLEDDRRIRVISDAALPTGNLASTKQTEQTYALMMHMSQSLGVNCTYCHNSRAFGDWSQSTPVRTNAWFGIRMVREINNDYITPIRDALPDYRLGPHGDVPKVSCTTCHQGIALPLNGTPAVEAFPSLAMANVATREELLPGTLEPMWDPAQAAQAPAADTQDTAEATVDGVENPGGDEALGEGETAGEVTEAEADPAVRESQEAAEEAGLSAPDPIEAANPDTETVGEVAVPLERQPVQDTAVTGEVPAPTQDAYPPVDEDTANVTPGLPPADAEALEDEAETEPLETVR